METLAAPIPFTQTVEIGSLALAMATERARRFMVAWQEALKALAHQVSPPESYIQTASTAVAVGDPEAAESAAQRLLDLTPRRLTAQQLVRIGGGVEITNNPDLTRFLIYSKIVQHANFVA